MFILCFEQKLFDTLLEAQAAKQSVINTVTLKKKVHSKSTSKSR